MNWLWHCWLALSIAFTTPAEKRYKEALFTSWARQSVPSSISTAAARKVFTKTSWRTKVSMGLASSTKDGNHRRPLLSHLCGERLCTISNWAFVPQVPRHHQENILQGAHTAPACFRLTQPWRGIQVTLIHLKRNSTETPLSSSTTLRLLKVWGCSYPLHWHITSEAGSWLMDYSLTPTWRRSVLFLGGAGPADCSRSDLHTSTGKKGAKTAGSPQLWWSPAPGEDVVIS